MRIIVSDSYKNITYETSLNTITESITVKKSENKFPVIDIYYESRTDFDVKRSGGVCIPVLEYKEETNFFYKIVEGEPHFVGHITLSNLEYIGNSITIDFYLEEQ